MFGKPPRVRVRRFEIDDPSHRTEMEGIKQRVVEREPGWAILTQREFTNKHGDVFVYMEWTEGVR